MGKIREREPQEDLKAEIARLTDESERHRRGMLRAQEESAQKSKVILRMVEENNIRDRIHREAVNVLLAAVTAASGNQAMIGHQFPNPPGNNGMVD